MNNLNFAESLSDAVGAGFAGAVVMVLSIYIFTKAKMGPAEVFSAIGSLFNKNADNTNLLGIVVHLIAALVFAFFYALIINLFGVTSPLKAGGVGALIGFFHGAVVSMLLTVAVAEHHPLAKFREGGFAIAVGHFISHIFYGFTVGLICGTLN